MENLQARVAYLQGLIEGMELSTDPKHGKIFIEMADVMKAIAQEIENLNNKDQWLEDYLESIDEDLLGLEDAVYAGDDDDWDDDWDDEDEDDEDDEYEDECCDCDLEDCVEVQCPNCHEVVCFQKDLLDSEDLIEVACPNCDTTVFTNDDDEEYEDEKE